MVYALLGPPQPSNLAVPVSCSDYWSEHCPRNEIAAHTLRQNRLAPLTITTLFDDSNAKSSHQGNILTISGHLDVIQLISDKKMVEKWQTWAKASGEL